MYGACRKKTTFAAVARAHWRRQSCGLGAKTIAAADDGGAPVSVAETLIADLEEARGWFCGASWYASYRPTFSQRIGELNRDYAAKVHREGAQLIVSRICRRHEHRGTIHEYALRKFVVAEQLKWSA